MTELDRRERASHNDKMKRDPEQPERTIFVSGVSVEGLGVCFLNVNKMAPGLEEGIARIAGPYLRSSQARFI